MKVEKKTLRKNKERSEMIIRYLQACELSVISHCEVVEHFNCV